MQTNRSSFVLTTPLSLSLEANNIPQSIDSLDNVIKVFSGSDHCFALTSNKLVYAWGNNASNRLGFPLNTSESAESIVRIPTILNSLSDKVFLLINRDINIIYKSIDNIATGNDHTFAWSEDTGEVYAWGSGNFGKLGFGSNENVMEPAILECFKEALNVGIKISNIACGDNHTLAILNTHEEDEKKEENKMLFVWGSSKNWQLGLDHDFGNILIPHQIDPDPWNGGIVQVFACNNYSAALNNKGELFTWGSGEFGRLGYSTETKQQKIPRIIKNLFGKKIIKVSLGGYHVGAITSEGALFTWGRGINGQLGHGSIYNEESPKEVKFSPPSQIINVSCGENHSLAISNEGYVFVWGANQFGQLGIGNVIRVNQPFHVSCFAENNIILIDITCGKKHTLALSEQGIMFSWGNNDYGQLGLDILSSQTKKQKTKESQQLNSPSELNSIFMRTKTNGAEFFMTNRNNSMNPNNNNIEAIPHIDKTATFLDGKVAESGTLTDFMPVSQIQDPMMRKLVVENKYLRGRIKELEFKTDVDAYQRNEEQIYNEANNFLQTLENFIFFPNSSSSIDNIELEIINKNSKVDKMVQEFKKKIDDIKDANFNAGFYSIQLVEKYVRLLKKSNYFTETKKT